MRTALKGLLLCLLLPWGCERLWLEPASTDPEALFDEAWRFVDKRYAYFEEKGVDWDAEYTRFRAGVESGMEPVALFDTLANMLFTLRDGHVNLSAPFDRSRNWQWFLDYPPNFDADLLERSYFQNEQRFVGPFVAYDFGDIGYIRYSSFSNEFGDGQWETIMNLFSNRQGLIVDIRGNGGGSLGTAYDLAGRFTDETVSFAQQRYRLAENREAFSPWETLEITPSDEGQRWTKPVVVLTNRSSYSAASFFAQMTRTLPNATLVGDTTGGGAGIPTFTTLANGWILRASHTQMATLDGVLLESGVPVAIQMDLDPDEAAAGRDSMLEAALQLLR